MSDLAKRLRIKAGMIEMGERIAWGSDIALMREAADALDHVAVERKKVGRPQIREAFLRNGARIEPGRDDLPDWVYESVFELMEMAAPAVQGEPVAIPARTSFGGPQRFTVAEQQPAPDVEALVEALEEIAKLPMDPCSTENDYRLSAARAIALAAVSDFRVAALAAHRKQQEPQP